MATRGKRALVFYADDTQEETNYYRFETLPNSKLRTLQRIVGGNIELLPHREGITARFMAYANEEGLLKDLPRNVLAGGVLLLVGFILGPAPLGCAYAGNVVVFGKSEKGLTAQDEQMLQAAIDKYLSLE